LAISDAPAATGRSTASRGQAQDVSASPVSVRPRRRQRLLNAVERQVLRRTGEFQHYGYSRSSHHAPPLYYHLAAEEEEHNPEALFGQLRWGGQLVYASSRKADIAQLFHQLHARGYAPTRGPGFVRYGPLRYLLPALAPKAHYLAARKVLLVPPREITDRFTYHVQLVEGETADEPVVLKEVPTVDRVFARLRAKFPKLPDAVIEKRARKFTDKIFPIFLTREAAMLKILQRDLPPAYRRRVPDLLDVEKDQHGFVQRLWMRWLRNGGRPLSQLDFARQGADMLRALHEEARIMHLDLRLDNMVITEEGVGFVDFGSAVRIGENIGQSPLLSTLFTELMRTSQIQRMLEDMTISGAVTSTAIKKAYHQVDPAVDFFYLAVQINAPQSNPELAGLVKFDPQSEQAKALANLTHDILKPPDPQHPPYHSASQILQGIDEIARSLGQA
jgi:hypothetical protein